MTKRKDQVLRPHISQPPPKHPRCQARLQAEAAAFRASRMSKGGYNGPPHTQCSNQSAYVIDGKYWCRRHAAYYLLDKEFPPPEVT